MKIIAKTDKGLIRATNQDAYAAGEQPDGMTWAVVCDGMGGANGGNVASSLAVKLISEQITSCYREGMSTKSIKNMLLSAITAANINIYDMGSSNKELSGMGTTVVVAMITDHTVCVAHAGDSRAYLITDDSLRQLTKDHSVVQELVETGQLTEDEAKKHPRKNLITRALGVDEDIDVDFCVEDMSDGSILLICTDGLTNSVETEDIFRITHESNCYEFAEKLVSLANSNGGSDNITVVAVAY
ncbi:MAG: Stp1/IreP family PP2C-type Ser/Thr phosphatase [Clostridiales bacterium]|nr:Stp1/IreP family PP2C-type Ser/Thr phosphatase [Clostridiales bacterium]